MQSASGGLPVIRGTEPRRLAAFVHADMVGYSRLIGQDDVGTYARLARLRHVLIDPALERYGGKIDNTAGDALLMEFSSVLSAVRFAVEIQTRMAEFDDGEPPDRRIRFRMGVNAGDAISDGETSTATASTLRRGCKKSVLRAAYAFRPLFAITCKTG